MPDDTKAQLQRRIDMGETIAAEDVELYLSVGTAQCLAGSFDPMDPIEENELVTMGTHSDFDLYAEEDGERAVVATNGTTLLGSGPGDSPYDSQAELELLIDTATGATDGAVKTNPDIELLAAELGDGVRHSLRTYPDQESELGLQGVVAGGDVAAIEGENTHIQSVGVYETESQVGLDTVEATTTDTLTDDAELVSLSQHGRAVHTEVRIPTAAFVI